MELYQIAIDGPAAAGKSTVAKQAAKRVGGFYVNTGEMYRTIALACIREGIAPDDEALVGEKLKTWTMEFQDSGAGEIGIIFNGKPVVKSDLRLPEVAMASSQVAKIPAVREWMKTRQRDCRMLGTIIMEGRDICTVILPDATAKFFITATPEERARRRLAQSGEVADGATLKSVAEEIAARDLQDSTRAIAPLKPAEDAKVIVTDGMSAEEVTDLVVKIFEEKKNALKS